MRLLAAPTAPWLRWPTGFCCPDCGVVGEPWEMAGGWLRCRACRRETSITAGTIFEGTRKPLRTWFLAIWFVTSQKNGMSALGLQRALGLGSYETSWTWLHKLRRAMGGGPAATTLPARSRPTKPMWAARKKASGAVRSRVRPSSRWRLNSAGAASGASAFGASRTSPPRACWPSCKKPWSRATIHTDGWRGYAGLPAAGYRHQVTVISGGSEPAHEVMPRVHKSPPYSNGGCWGLSRAASSTNISTITSTNSTFRFNRRRSQARGLLFHRLVQQAVAIGPAPYHSIITPRISANLPELGE